MAAAPLVSIVIPCYNQAAYLRQAIDSVLAQDYAPLELLVVDDGSTDGSAVIAREAVARCAERCTVIVQENAGQSSAVNRGWARARGELIAYLAADDFLLPNAVRRSVECLEREPDAVLCYCDYLLVDPMGRVVRRVTAPEFSRRDLVTRLVCAPGPGALLRRSAFERAGPWNERLRQIPDFELWLRLAAEGRFCRIGETLAAYRAHEGSQSFAPVAPARADEAIVVMEDYFRLGRAPRDCLDGRDESLSSARIVAARLHLRSGRYREGFRLLGAALRLWPRNFLRFRTWHVIANGLFNRLAHRILWMVGRKNAVPAGEHG
jgi:glycosyltransferase involved in cell wall biosynthesis